jgi:hypothetical protein
MPIIALTIHSNMDLTKYLEILQGDIPSLVSNIMGIRSFSHISEHLIENIGKYTFMKELIDPIVHSMSRGLNTHNQLEVIKNLITLKDENDLPFVDINREINGSALITYYRNSPEMLEFLLSNGAEYKTIAGASLEERIANDYQSAHGSTEVDLHALNLLKALAKFSYNGKGAIDNNSSLFALIRLVADSIVHNKSIENIEGVNNFQVITTAALVSIGQSKIEQFITNKLKGDYKNKLEEEKEELKKLANFELFFNKVEKAFEATQINTSVLNGEKVELSSLVSSVYAAIIKIANQDSSTLIPNIWDLMIEIVDCATMYSPNGYSCSNGVIRKILSVVDSKHQDLTAGLYQALEKISSFDDINKLPLATYTKTAWSKLTAKQQEAFKEQFFIECKYSKVCNVFLGKIYQTLKELYPQITPTDAEVVKTVILNHTGNELVTVHSAFSWLCEHYMLKTQEIANELEIVSKVLSEMVTAVEMNLSGEHPEISFLDM